MIMRKIFHVIKHSAVSLHTPNATKKMEKNQYLYITNKNFKFYQQQLQKEKGYQLYHHYYCDLVSAHATPLKPKQLTIVLRYLLFSPQYLCSKYRQKNIYHNSPWLGDVKTDTFCGFHGKKLSATLKLRRRYRSPQRE